MTILKKYILKLFLLLFGVLIAFGASAQVRNVTGKVTSADGNPIPGATIMVKGTASGTTSDVNGRFAISVKNQGAVLIISFVGFEKSEVTIGAQKELFITLKENVRELDQVVVIGYGTTKKSDLTSSISSVKGTEIKKMTVGNVTTSLQGKVPGLQVFAGSGAPGATPKVLVRGFTSINLSTDPLYVVDGIPMGTNINFLNPSEVESIEVLKDASACAIYGSRGSNGVILITTIRGKEGKTQYSVDISYGTQIFNEPYKMANATEYAKIMNLSRANSGLPVLFADPNSLGAGTDWWGSGIRKFSPQRNASFQMSGGTEKNKFALNVSYYDQESFYTQGDWKKFTARFSNDFKLNNWLSAGYMLNPRRESWNNTPNWFQDYMVIDPITPIYIPQDQRAGKNEYSIFSRSYYTYTWNPAARMARQFGKGGAYSATTNAYLDIKPIKDLVIKSQISYDISYNLSNDFQPDFIIDGAHEKNEINSVSRNESLGQYWAWQNTATYDKIFGNHNLKAMIGTTTEQWTGSSLWGSKQGIPNNTDNLRELDAATLNPQTSGSSWTTAMESYLGRLSYNFSSKYFLTATYRVDGSSKFMKNNKWASFPSASVAWRISKEKFMEGITFVNDLKLRGGWGRIGNQDLPSYVYNSGLGREYYVFGPGMGSLGNTTYPSSIKNEDIKWETVEDINFGTDFSLLNSTLSGSVEYYQKSTKDMLFQLPYPNYSGYPNDAQIWSNIGSMQSKGWDIAVNYRNTIQKFNYNIGVTLMTVGVKVKSLPASTPVIYNGSQTTKTVEGDVPGYFYGYKTDGIFQNQIEINSHTSQHGELLQPNARPGDVRFVDVNKDGFLDGNDRTKIGSPWPDFTGGFNLGASYGNFDLTANFYFSVGNKISNSLNNDLYNTQNYNNVLSGLMDVAWHGEGTSNKYPIISHTDDNQNFSKYSDLFIEDGSYLRLKNLQIGYNLPSKMVEKIGFTKCRFYVSGQNVWTLTKYKGIEPEVGGGGVLDFGFAGWNYPVQKTIIFGLNLSF